MCFTGENGWASVYNISYHRARKQRRCCECGGPIPVGTRYEYLFMVFDGSPGGWHTHLECAVLWDFCITELCHNEGTRAVGCLREEIGEYGAYGGDYDEDDELREVTLMDIVDAVADGYERQVAA